MSPSGTPFDWMLSKGAGVTVQVAAKSDKPGERALHLQFGPGRVDYREVTQLIMLSPGSYQFEGKYKGDLVSERGLEWRIVSRQMLKILCFCCGDGRAGSRVPRAFCLRAPGVRLSALEIVFKRVLSF